MSDLAIVFQRVRRKLALAAHLGHKNVSINIQDIELLMTVAEKLPALEQKLEGLTAAFGHLEAAQKAPRPQILTRSIADMEAEARAR